MQLLEIYRELLGFRETLKARYDKNSCDRINAQKSYLKIYTALAMELKAD